MRRERERERERDAPSFERSVRRCGVCERETGGERKKKRERDASLERAVRTHRCVMKVGERENP